MSQLCRSGHRFKIADHGSARQGTSAVAKQHCSQVCIEWAGYKQYPLPAQIRKEPERGRCSIFQALPWILTVRARNNYERPAYFTMHPRLETCDQEIIRVINVVKFGVRIPTIKSYNFDLQSTSCLFVGFG